jgi:hypothetical protein
VSVGIYRAVYEETSSGPALPVSSNGTPARVAENFPGALHIPRLTMPQHISTSRVGTRPPTDEFVGFLLGGSRSAF